jgi:hypothetical protein
VAIQPNMVTTMLQACSPYLFSQGEMGPSLLVTHGARPAS